MRFFFESFSKNEILSTYSSLWSLWCIHKVTQGITLRACATTTSNLIFFAALYPKSKRGIQCDQSPLWFLVQGPHKPDLVPAISPKPEIRLQNRLIGFDRIARTFI